MLDNRTTAPIAGWYTDPTDSTRERWWGGVEWTDNVRPLEAVIPPVFAQQPLYSASSSLSFAAFSASQFAAHSATESQPVAVAPTFTPEPVANPASSFDQLRAQPAVAQPLVVADVPAGPLRERRRREPDLGEVAVASPLPEEGWYTDPADAGQERRWNGSEWTHELRPVGTASVTTVNPADVPGGGINPFAPPGLQKLWQAQDQDQPIAPPRVEPYPSWQDQAPRPVYGPPPTNGMATAGLVLSLLCISLLGLIFSIKGLVRANSYASLGHAPVGRTRAALGLAASFAMPLIIGVLAAIAIPVFLDQRQDRAQEQIAAVAQAEGVSKSDVVLEKDGTPVVYDRAEVEQMYTDTLAAEGVEVDSLSCPDSASMVVGGGFTCTFVIEGATHFVGITWTSNDADFSMTVDGVVQK